MRTLSILLLSLGVQLTWAGPYVHGHADRSLEQALRTGTDTDGKPLYLCIANIFNSIQPGKTWAGYGRCNVAYGGKEYITSDFKIPPRNLFHNVAWQRNPVAPLKVGREADGKPLFLCQARFKGGKQPGKTWPGYPHCNVSYAGQEIILNSYEILKENNQNHTHHSSNANHTHRHTPSAAVVTEYNS